MVASDFGLGYARPVRRLVKQSMGQKLDQLVQLIREEKGPFFMARLCLRLDFDLNPGVTQDSVQRELQLVETCRGLGYEMNRANAKPKK
jgi:hypothetical protein